MNNKKIFIIFILIFTFFISKNIYCQDNAKVYVIKKLEFQEINRWYAAYIKKAIKKASDEEEGVLYYAKDEEIEDALIKLGAKRKYYDYDEDEDDY